MKNGDDSIFALTQQLYYPTLNVRGAFLYIHGSDNVWHEGLIYMLKSV